MKIFEAIQAVLATLAFICAVITTGAMIYRGDALIGIIAYTFITTLIGGLTYMSYQELKNDNEAQSEEGGDQ